MIYGNKFTFSSKNIPFICADVLNKISSERRMRDPLISADRMEGLRYVEKITNDAIKKENKTVQGFIQVNFS